MQTELVHEPSDVVAELAKLDLELSDVLDPGKAWLLALSNWSPNHPRVYRGLSAWAEGVKTLRDPLVAKKWDRSEERSYPLTIHPSGAMCIAVASGDYDTGIVGGNPKNKVPKGPRTAEVVEQNSTQMRLFDDEIPSIPKSLMAEAKGQRITYILLIYVDMGARVIRSELSVPMDMNAEGLIIAWRKRIILPAVPFDGDPMQSSDPKTPELDIDVKRKAA